MGGGGGGMKSYLGFSIFRVWIVGTFFCAIRFFVASCVSGSSWGFRRFLGARNCEQDEGVVGVKKVRMMEEEQRGGGLRFEYEGQTMSRGLDTVKLFVGQLPKQLTEQQLASVFSEAGTVYEINIIKDKLTKQSRGQRVILLLCLACYFPFFWFLVWCFFMEVLFLFIFHFLCLSFYFDVVNIDVSKKGDEESMFASFFA
jgi:hypothetical protein